MSGVVNHYTSPDGGQVIDAEVVPEPKPITGLDEKTYPAKPKPKPRRQSIVDAVRTAVRSLDKDVARIAKLVADDRFTRATVVNSVSETAVTW